MNSLVSLASISTISFSSAIPLDILLTFFGASLLLAASPGPDNIFVLTQSALHGKKAGLYVTAGLSTGLLGHTAAAVIGVAALVQSSPLALNAIKLAGASYLLYLAWQALVSTQQNIRQNSEIESKPLSTWGLYSRGIFMNISNPKVALFFLAFFPQFTNEAFGDVPSQMLTLGGVFILATAICFSAIAIAAGSLSAKLQQSNAIQIWLNRIASLIFVYLAANLVFN